MTNQELLKIHKQALDRIYQGLEDTIKKIQYLQGDAAVWKVEVFRLEAKIQELELIEKINQNQNQNSKEKTQNGI